MSKHLSLLALLLLSILLIPTAAESSHISGIRITQTGNTGLMVNVDVTGFYTTGSTETTMNLGTYYNQVPAIDWGDGSTTPRYGLGPSTGIPLVATSTVVNGIPARAFRGSFSHTYAAAGNYTISANTSCCPLTTPTYTLVSGTLLTTTVSTSGPFGPTTFTTSFVQNTLTHGSVAPGFSKSFTPDLVGQNNASTLTFTIDNTGSTLDNNALDFTDNLPGTLVVDGTPNAVNTCTGGTLTATAGSGVISYTGGVVAAGATCTISVDVSSPSSGILVNTTGDLTSAFGNSGTASDTITVVDPPTFAKAFAPNITGVGGVSTLTFTIDNSANAIPVPGLDFTDNLPAGMEVSATPNASTTCTGGTLTATAGSSVVSYTGGTVASSTVCTVAVDVTPTSTGVLVNTSGDLTSDFGNSGTANDSLTVGSSPLFSKSFSPDNLNNTLMSTLTFTIDNSANAVDATGLSFMDTMPPGMNVATPANVVDTCVGGVVTAVSDTSDISYAGGTVTAGSICTISVDITVAGAGNYENISGPLVSSLGTSAAGSATDSLMVMLLVPALSVIGLLFMGLCVFGIVAYRRKQSGDLS